MTALNYGWGVQTTLLGIGMLVFGLVFLIMGEWLYIVMALVGLAVIGITDISEVRRYQHLFGGKKL